MRLAALPLLLAPLLSPLAQAATLSVCTEASPEGFDVVQYNSLTTTNASADVLMNRLVEFDASSGKVVPSLADSWEISSDGLTYVFRLHPKVKFHRTDYFTPAANSPPRTSSSASNGCSIRHSRGIRSPRAVFPMRNRCNCPA